MRGVVEAGGGAATGGGAGRATTGAVGGATTGVGGRAATTLASRAIASVASTRSRGRAISAADARWAAAISVIRASSDFVSATVRASSRMTPSWL